MNLQYFLWKDQDQVGYNLHPNTSKLSQGPKVAAKGQALQESLVKAGSECREGIAINQDQSLQLEADRDRNCDSGYWDLICRRKSCACLHNLIFDVHHSIS